MRLRTQSITTLLSGIVRDDILVADLSVTGIAQDSRKTVEGDLFIALATEREQREQHISQAISNGCKVILTDSQNQLTEQEKALISQKGIKHFSVQMLAEQTGEIAARFYDHPSRKLTLFAVTGTNGKTSVSQFIAQSLETLGAACGVIGTLGVGRVTALTDTGMTTPDPVSVQQILAEFCHQGYEYAVIEASSHALAQGRLNSVEIDIAVLTNLTRDHLDYHQNLENYADAKARLFDFESVETAVINKDDAFGQKLFLQLSAKDKPVIWCYSAAEKEVNADFSAKNKQLSASGLSFDLVSIFGNANIKSALYGQFNVSNLLATIAALMAANKTFDDVIKAVTSCHAVEGRMEVLDGYKQAHIIIDFAHTPDALEQVLQSLHAHLGENDEMWCVFGCGGERDKGKRPLMGQIAEQYADHIVITDDNPRGEDARKIVEDILKGIQNREKTKVEQDRKLAIHYATSHAKQGDIVLIAGKGHEQYQEINGVKYPFSDKKVVHDLILEKEAVQ